MTDVIALIDTIIEEHKIILGNLERLEQAVNDAGALMILEHSKDAFMPGRLSPRAGLHELENLQKRVENGLLSHFNREETALLQAFQEYGQDRLVTALKTLLNEHAEIRSELSILKSHVAELSVEKLSRTLWESKGYDLRARITQLHKTIATHAADERSLFHQVQKDLKNHRIITG